MQKKHKGFFPEEFWRSEFESEDQKRWRKNKETLRKIRKKERDDLKKKMITKTGLLYTETKSAYDWKMADRRQARRMDSSSRRKKPITTLLQQQSKLKEEQAKTQANPNGKDQPKPALTIEIRIVPQA